MLQISREKMKKKLHCFPGVNFYSCKACGEGRIKYRWVERPCNEQGNARVVQSQ